MERNVLSSHYTCSKDADGMANSVDLAQTCLSEYLGSLRESPCHFHIQKLMLQYLTHVIGQKEFHKTF